MSWDQDFLSTWLHKMYLRRFPHEQTIFSQPPSHRTGRTRRFQREFSLFLSHCFVQDSYLPAYGNWPPSKPHTAANTRLTKQCKSRTSMGCSFPETASNIRNQKFRNILDCRLHQDSSFFTLTLYFIQKFLSAPHLYKTSRCLYTHIIYINA